MKVGKGDDPLTRVCPVINRKQYSRILSAIDEAAANGARCVCGGRALTSGEYAKGNYIEPTIFTEVDIHSELARSEIFGPVLAVFKIQSLEEAVEQMNTSGYGLSASVFTANINAAMWALEKIQAGCCYVNAPTFGSEPHMPFGGVKLSGNGSREPGTQALDVFSEWKTIYMDYSGLAQNSQYRIK
jgi:aldehyde dehydrogenase (NAD+)